MISIDKKNFLLIALIIILVAAGAWAGYTIIHANTPVRIGVLLPLTGDVELKEPLEWAQENINRAGGIGGRPVELVYKDTGAGGNTTELAEELLSDPSIRIVIGPPTSDDVYTLAPEFATQDKLLISPLATSGDIIRAFGKKGYFWRTTQGDVAQVKVLLSILKEKGATKAALLAENSTYGETFYDWTGFFATEYGLTLTSVRQFDPGSSSLDADVTRALADNPDYIIAACGPEDAAAIKTAIDRSGKTTKLILSDAAATPVLTGTLGSSAEGIEGTSPTADPTTGFAVAYKEKFGHAPTDYAAPAYDALLLAAYATARQDPALFESPADSMRHVVYGNGTAAGWDTQGIREAIAQIRAGGSPSISGASGPLDYDTEYGVDPLETWYSHWVIEDGAYRTVSAIDAAKTGTIAKSGVSAGRSSASSVLMNALTGSAGPGPAVNKTGFYAVVVGPSKGWSNYRHQADALTIYRLLRANGVDDDHIILMIYDDVPTLAENPLKGNIHNIPKGENIRSGADVTYSGRNVTAETFMNVLLGNRTAETPVVLESNATSDVFVYIASHGSPGSVVFGYNDTLTTDGLASVTKQMYSTGKYRQLLFVVDTCFGESVAANTTSPGILYFTGASSAEPSLGAVYDPDIKQWLSDEFTSSMLGVMNDDANITFRDLYAATYEDVTGSHVKMKDTGNFSLDTPVREYLSP
ncbi:MAG: ABC transporter substrate-binding protein [Methanoregula sp.]|nr:ABC transporter substrate-binding protein [Methanoregula sp.]